METREPQSFSTTIVRLSVVSVSCLCHPLQNVPFISMRSIQAQLPPFLPFLFPQVFVDVATVNLLTLRYMLLFINSFSLPLNCHIVLLFGQWFFESLFIYKYHPLPHRRVRPCYRSLTVTFCLCCLERMHDNIRAEQTWLNTRFCSHSIRIRKLGVNSAFVSELTQPLIKAFLCGRSRAEYTMFLGSRWNML